MGNGRDNSMLKGLAIAGGAVLVLMFQSFAQDQSNDDQVNRLKKSLRKQDRQLKNQSIIIQEVRQGNAELKCLLLLPSGTRTVADTRKCNTPADAAGRRDGGGSQGPPSSSYTPPPSSSGSQGGGEKPRPQPKPKPKPTRPPREDGTVCVEAPLVGRECF